MQTLNKEYILRTLSEEKLWKVGESDTFTFENWTITLRKEETKYKPYMYSINGIKKNTRETWSRRYITMEEAFLHVLNHFNENSNIRDKYETLPKALKSMKE